MCRRTSPGYQETRRGWFAFATLGWGVPPGSPNLDPTVSDQKLSFFTLVFRPACTRPGTFEKRAPWPFKSIPFFEQHRQKLCYHLCYHLFLAGGGGRGGKIKQYKVASVFSRRRQQKLYRVAFHRGVVGGGGGGEGVLIRKLNVSIQPATYVNRRVDIYLNFPK